MDVRRWLATLLARRGKQPAPALASMEDEIDLWTRMYAGNAPWIGGDIVSLGLPALVASEIARLSTLEMRVTLTGGARAAFLRAGLEDALRDARRFTERAAAVGSLVIKPYVADGRFGFDYVPAGRFFPTHFSSSGEMTGCAFLESAEQGGFLRVEHHLLGPAGVTVTNLCFKKRGSADDMYDPVPLRAVDKWADVCEEALIAGAKRPLYALLTMPQANPASPESPLGVSCFSRAVGLIREADKQFSRLLWEMESGQRALYVDLRAFTPEETTPGALPFKRFYRTVDFGASPDAGLFEAWSPALREGGQIAALSCVLEKVEDACGFSRGMLAAHSEHGLQPRTATELSMMRQRTYATVRDVQKQIETALERLVCAMDCWASALCLCEPGAYGIRFDFDDSIVSDRDAQFRERLSLLEAGVIEKEELRAWYFGETRRGDGGFRA